MIAHGSPRREGPPAAGRVSGSADSAPICATADRKVLDQSACLRPSQSTDYIVLDCFRIGAYGVKVVPVPQLKCRAKNGTKWHWEAAF
jgi:hypothetical protein